MPMAVDGWTGGRFGVASAFHNSKFHLLVLGAPLSENHTESKYTAWLRLRTSSWKSGFGQTMRIVVLICLTYELISRFHFEGNDSIQVWLNLAGLFCQSLPKFRMLQEWAFKAFIPLMIAMQSQQWQRFDKQIDACNNCCNMVKLSHHDEGHMLAIC